MGWIEWVNSNLTIIVDIAIVFFLIVAGYSQIAKGTIYINKEHYTKESIRAFSKPMGLLTWMLALSLAVVFFGNANVLSETVSKYISYAGDAAVVLTFVIYFIAAKKILKRKKETSSMKYTYHNKKRKY